MRARVALSMMPLAAVLTVAANPAPASARFEENISCEAESLIRFTCEFDVPRRNERTMLNKTPKCDRFRDFTAEPEDEELSGLATRDTPRPTFLLRDNDVTDDADDEADPGPMRVKAYVNSKRIKFRNLSKYAVTVSFSMRCASVNF